MKKLIYIKLIFLLLTFFVVPISGVTIKPLKTTELKLEDNDILLVGSIAVNDENIFITDRKAANIKILDHQGSLVKVFGRKGYGPKEFQQPFTSFINGNNYYVLDLELDKLSCYRISTHGLRIIKHYFFCNYICDIKPYEGNRFVVAGYFFIDDNYVSVAEFDPEKEKLTKKLILAKQWIGVKTKHEVKKKMFTTYRHLSYDGFVEVTGSHLFYVPGSHLTILRMDKKSKAVKRIVGKSVRFMEPELPHKDLERATQTRSHTLWMNSIQKRSFVLDTFLFDAEYLIVVFSYFNEDMNSIDLYYHAYDSTGKFIKEALLLHSRSLYTEQMAFYYDAKQKNYYVFNSYDKDDESIVSRIHRFKVAK